MQYQYFRMLHTTFFKAPKATVQYSLGDFFCPRCNLTVSVQLFYIWRLFWIALRNILPCEDYYFKDLYKLYLYLLWYADGFSESLICFVLWFLSLAFRLPLRNKIPILKILRFFCHLSVFFCIRLSVNAQKINIHVKGGFLNVLSGKQNTSKTPIK